MRINIHEISRDRDIDNLCGNEKVTGFVIYDIDEAQPIEIREKNNNSIYLGDQILEMVSYMRNHSQFDEDGWVAIPLQEIDVEEDVFFNQFDNNEITKPLKELKSMIEKGKEVKGVTSISQLISRLDTLLKEGGIYIETVHIEIIARNLIRDRLNTTSLPDYSKDDIDIAILSIHQSIHSSPSLLTSMTFERLNQQFKNPETYYKHGTSPWDVLFTSN